MVRFASETLEGSLPATIIPVPLTLLIEAGLLLPEAMTVAAQRDGTWSIDYEGSLDQECFVYFSMQRQMIFCLQDDIPSEYDAPIDPAASIQTGSQAPKGIPVLEYARAVARGDTLDERLQEEIGTDFSPKENYMQRFGRSFWIDGDRVASDESMLVVPRRRLLVEIPLRLLLSAELTNEETLRARGARPISP